MNISSLAAVSGVAGQTAYAASKAAVPGLTRALAREVGKRGVRVNAILPGFVSTDMTAALSEETVRALRSHECLPQGTSVDDVGNLVAFLISQRAAAITGQAVLGRFHVTGVFWYQFPHWAFSRLPSWIDRPVILVFTAFFFCTLGRIRRSIASNLEPVLGPSSRWGRWRRSLKTMHSFAWCLAERYRFLAEPDRFRAVLDGEENWRRAVASGTGVVLVTAHIGPWENAVRFGASGVRRRIHLGGPPPDPRHTHRGSRPRHRARSAERRH